MNMEQRELPTKNILCFTFPVHTVAYATKPNFITEPKLAWHTPIPMRFPIVSGLNIFISGPTQRGGLTSGGCTSPVVAGGLTYGAIPSLMKSDLHTFLSPHHLKRPV